MSIQFENFCFNIRIQIYFKIIKFKKKKITCIIHIVFYEIFKNNLSTFNFEYIYKLKLNYNLKKNII